MSAFAQLKALQATLEGFLPGSRGERIFWQDIAEEAAALAKFAQQQAKREDRERAARGVHRLKGEALNLPRGRFKASPFFAPFSPRKEI